jgi:hypothetical protein
MAEFACRDCGTSLSPDADECPHCGYSPHPKWVASTVLVAGALATVLFGVGALVAAVAVSTNTGATQPFIDFLYRGLVTAGSVQAVRWGLRERQKTVTVRVPQSRTRDAPPDADD